MVESMHRMTQKIDSKTAFKIANRFILERMRDRFSAASLKRVIFPTREVWIVSVVLTYPKKGIVGKVGAIAVDGETGEIVGWTPIEEMEAVAKDFMKGKKRSSKLHFHKFKRIWDFCNNLAIVIERS
jgi:hypothetical protein